MDGGFRIKERVAFLFGSVVAMEIMEYYGLTKKRNFGRVSTKSTLVRNVRRNRYEIRL